MSQWGETATFADERAMIRVMPHIDTGDYAFAPIMPESKIDSVYLTDIVRGDQDDAHQLFLSVAAQHTGALYADWPRGLR